MECQQTPEFTTVTGSCKGESRRVFFIVLIIIPTYSIFIRIHIFIYYMFFLYDQEQMNLFLLPNGLPYGIFWSNEYVLQMHIMRYYKLFWA